MSSGIHHTRREYRMPSFTFVSVCIGKKLTGQFLAIYLKPNGSTPKLKRCWKHESALFNDKAVVHVALLNCTLITLVFVFAC